MPSFLLVKANEATAAKRTVSFDLRDASNALDTETGEAGGQPQVMTTASPTWTNTGIGTLTAVGNGRYVAALTQTLVATAGTIVHTRYASVNTVETPGDSVQVVGFDPAGALSTFDYTTQQVQADVRRIAAQTVTGSTLAANFQSFFTSDPITAIWSFAKATAAALAATTIGRFLYDQAAFLTSGVIQASGPYSDGTLITIFQGEDRDTSNSNALVFTLPDSITPGSGCTGVLKLTRLEGAGTATLTKTVTPVGQTCTFEMTDTETGALSANATPLTPNNPDSTGYAYRWTFYYDDGTNIAVLAQHYVSVKPM